MKTLMKTNNVWSVTIAIVLFSMLFSCESYNSKEISELTFHEERVADHYSQNKNETRIIGYNTVFPKD